MLFACFEMLMPQKGDKFAFLFAPAADTKNNGFLPQTRTETGAQKQE
jgi:hypothetical protein